jgi:hypothetical protein
MAEPRRRPGAFEPEPAPERPGRRGPPLRAFEILRIAILVTIGLLVVAMLLLDLPLQAIGGKAVVIVGLLAAIVFLRR